MTDSTRPQVAPSPNGIIQRDRGDGTTTRQITNSPVGAFYVVHDRAMKDYVRHLLRRLGREDITIVTPSFFERGLRGVKRPMFVVDHAASALMTMTERDNMNRVLHDNHVRGCT